MSRPIQLVVLTPARRPALQTTISGAGEFVIRINSRTGKNGTRTLARRPRGACLRSDRHR